MIDSFRGIARQFTRRRMAVVTGHDNLHCPNGHRLTDTKLIWNDGAFRCSAKGKDGRPMCDALMLVIGGGFKTLSGKTLLVCAEITPEELKAISDNRMDAEMMVDYLSLTFNPAEM